LRDLADPLSHLTISGTFEGDQIAG
jgi:hypothetical protein